MDSGNSLEPLNISIIELDITKAKTKAIVNSIGSRYETKGAICKAILKKCGKSLKHEIVKNGQDKYDLPLPEGAVIVTSGGDSSFTSIFHIVLLKFKETRNHTENMLTETTFSILDEANKSGLRSVAMPPFGTGVLKTPITVWVRAMKKGMKKFIKKNKNSIKCKNIDICIFDEQAWEEFQTEWSAPDNEEAKDDDSESDDGKNGKGKGARNIKKFESSDDEESKANTHVKKGKPTKFNDSESEVDSDDTVAKPNGKTINKKSMMQNKPPSDDSDSDETVNVKEKTKTKIVAPSSDSESDDIKKKPAKGKPKKLDSDSESEEEEKKQVKKSQKKSLKNVAKNAVSSSSDDSDDQPKKIAKSQMKKSKAMESDSDSDDPPAKSNKKTAQPKKKQMDSSEDSEESDELPKSKAKGTMKKKQQITDSDSD